MQGTDVPEPRRKRFRLLVDKSEANAKILVAGALDLRRKLEQEVFGDGSSLVNQPDHSITIGHRLYRIGRPKELMAPLRTTSCSGQGVML